MHITRAPTDRTGPNEAVGQIANEHRTSPYIPIRVSVQLIGVDLIATRSCSTRRLHERTMHSGDPPAREVMVGASFQLGTALETGTGDSLARANIAGLVTKVERMRACGP